MKNAISASQAKNLITDKLSHFFGVSPTDANDEQFYKAVSMIVREKMSEMNSDFRKEADGQDSKQVYYLCMEFLMGRSLKNNLYNLGLTKVFDEALNSMGVNINKLYEKEPAEVEHLFCDVLFASDHGDLNQRQKNMEAFLDGMEKLREKHFPANWSYKQDRHSASTFLAMYAPQSNYVYKFSEAETMAVYGEYGFDIGAGANFNLQYYYDMCDEIVEQLKKHDTLLETHFKKLGEDCYNEKSLHLLAFDVMYCCRTYGYYKGLSHIAKKDSVRLAKEAEKQKETEVLLQEKINTLAGEIEELKLSLPDISDIDLNNVEVTSKKYGTGMVIAHELNKIKVQFDDDTKDYILDKKFKMRPTFEHDVEVIEAYSEYDEVSKKIEFLKKQMEELILAIKM